MARFNKLPYAILAFILVYVGIAIDAGIHRGDWWFARLFGPIPFRDVQVTAIDETEVQLTYIPSDCALGPVSAYGQSGNVTGLVPVFGVEQMALENGLEQVSIDTDLYGLNYDTLRIQAQFDCGGATTTRTFATIRDGQTGAGHANYTGPEGGSVQSD